MHGDDNVLRETPVSITPYIETSNDGNLRPLVFLAVLPVGKPVGRPYSNLTTQAVRGRAANRGRTLHEGEKEDDEENDDPQLCWSRCDYRGLRGGIRLVRAEGQCG